jgi:hypothetical protein
MTMGFELERILYETEDFLRRNLGSHSRREAKKRRLRRKLEEWMRRLKRAGLILAGLLMALVSYSLFVGPIGFFTWLVALPTAFLLAFLSLFWGARRGARAIEPMTPELPLSDLAARVEDGLLDRSPEFPGRALPASDAIMARLAELQPHLGTLDPQSILAGDARRLIGQHLPRLVDAYLELPASVRSPGSQSSQRFIDSLGIVARELDGLLDKCCRHRHDGFETQSRFIETRYRDNDFQDK